MGATGADTCPAATVKCLLASTVKRFDSNSEWNILNTCSTADDPHTLAESGRLLLLLHDVCCYFFLNISSTLGPCNHVPGSMRDNYCQTVVMADGFGINILMAWWDQL